MNSSPVSPPEGDAGDVVLARRFRKPELPTFLLLWKYLPVPPGYKGLVTVGEHILGAHPEPVGKISKFFISWNLPFFGRNRRAVRILSAPVHAELELHSLEAGGTEAQSLAANLATELKIADPLAFYSNLPAEAWVDYRVSDLSSLLSVGIGKMLQRRLMDYSAESLLQDDGEIGRRLAAEIGEELKKTLAPRGIALTGLEPLVFRPYEEPVEILPLLEELKQEAKAESPETVLASLQKVEALGAAARDSLGQAFARSPEEGQKALADLVNRTEQEKENELATRALQLKAVESLASGKGPALPSVQHLSRVGVYLALLLIIGAASAYLAIFRTTHFQSEAGAGAGVVMLIGVMLLIQAVVDHAMSRALPQVTEPLSKFLMSLVNWRAGKAPFAAAQAAQTPAIQPVRTAPAPSYAAQPPLQAEAASAAPAKPKPSFLEEWLEKDAIRADEKVRRQVSIELTQTVNTINEARMKAYRANDREGTAALKELASAAEVFRLKVEGAPQYRQTLSKEWKDKPKELAARVIGFEEELLRQAQGFSLSGARLLPGAEEPAAAPPSKDGPPPLPTPPPTAESLAAQLRRLERHFANRETVFAWVTR